MADYLTHEDFTKTIADAREYLFGTGLIMLARFPDHVGRMVPDPGVEDQALATKTAVLYNRLARLWIKASVTYGDVDHIDITKPYGWPRGSL